MDIQKQNNAARCLQYTDNEIEFASIVLAIHNSKFVHCDIKPLNIMINDKHQLKIIDLSAAKNFNTKIREFTPLCCDPLIVVNNPYLVRYLGSQSTIFSNLNTTICSKLNDPINEITGQIHQLQISARTQTDQYETLIQQKNVLNGHMEYITGGLANQSSDIILWYGFFYAHEGLHNKNLSRIGGLVIDAKLDHLG